MTDLEMLAAARWAWAQQPDLPVTPEQERMLTLFDPIAA